METDVNYDSQIVSAMMHVVLTLFSALHDIKECAVVVEMYNDRPQSKIIAALEETVTSASFPTDAADAVAASLATFNTTADVYVKLLPTIERFIAENPDLCRIFLERVTAPLPSTNEEEKQNTVSMRGQVYPSYGNDTEH